MLIFTLTMENLLILASFCFLTLCQSVTVRDDDGLYEPESKRYFYQDTELTPDSFDQDGQLQYYKPARRFGRITSQPVQYAVPEEAIPQADYNYPAQQPLEVRTENLSPGESYEQQLARRLGAVAKKPLVEQYLKEVTPTTKTTYNRRAGNYLRSSTQATVRGNKQQTEETQRNVLKQSPPFQYVLQSELQQKPRVQPQIQYEIPEQKLIQPHQPDTSSLSRYQNALLAHQKVLLETTNPEESKSSIYVNHAIPKKPMRKQVKPKQSSVDEDVEYYTQLQQYQQQLQSKPQFYEQQQPAQVMYQAKLRYPKEGGTTTDEASTYQQQLRQHQQQILQYQPPAPRQAKKTRRPVKYQPVYHTTQESANNPSYEHQTPTKPEEPVNEQRATPLRQGPKYLPEPKTVRYQPSPLEESGLKYQHVVIPGQPQQSLISYEAAITKLQSEQHTPRSQGIRQQPVYRQQEQVQPQPEKFQLQYTEESQQGANQDEAEVEYVRPEQAIRLRPVGRATAYRQGFAGGNVRYYRNLGRPVSYSNYE